MSVVKQVRLNQTDDHLTHWGQMTHICVSKLTIIGSDNSLSPGRRQAIIWTNAGILLIGSLRKNFSETLIDILRFAFQKMHLKMSSGKWRPSCLDPIVLNNGWMGVTRLCGSLRRQISRKHNQVGQTEYSFPRNRVFQISAPPLFWEMIQNANMILSTKHFSTDRFV